MSEERDGGPGRPLGREEWPTDDSRLLEARRDALKRAGGTCSVSEAAETLGITVDDVRGRVDAGRLIALETEDGELRVPRVQFASGGILPGIEEVLAAMNVNAPWMRLQLLLDDDVLGALRTGRIDEATIAASSYLSGRRRGG